MKNNLTVIKSESSNVFGGYLEYIAGNSNSNKTSLFNFGNTFKNPDYPVGTEKAKKHPSWII